MPYTPPVGNAVTFDFTGVYSPPGGSVVVFDFGAVTVDENNFVSGPPIRLEFRGFSPQITNPLRITSGAPSYLQFRGFLPSVVNSGGMQVEAFSVYAVGSDDAPDLQVEQYGAYVLGLGTAELNADAFSFYAATSRNPVLAIEAYSLYIAASAPSELTVEQLGYYIVSRSTPLVIPALAATVPETPIGEQWAWSTDVIISEDGSEQRINLRNEPVRTFSNRYVFADGNEVRAAKQQLFAAFREEVAIPLHVYATRLKAVAAIGAMYLTFNPAKTDLREDRGPGSNPRYYVLVIEGSTYEMHLVDTIDGTGCSITTPLANAYTLKAKVMPIALSVIDNGAALIQYPGNGAASLTLKGKETSPVTPFLRPGTPNDLTIFDGIPVLERRAMGDEFNDVYDMGMTKIDFGGKVHFRTPWNFTKLSGERSFLCNRVLDPDDWDYFKTFFDYCKGSVCPFYLPTYREDFDVVTPAASSGDEFTVAGQTYSADYFDNPAFKQIMITSDAGVHYATIVGTAADGDDEVLTFSPALSADALWASNQDICLLLRARLGTDEVNLEHQSLHTIFGTSIRTIDA